MSLCPCGSGRPYEECCETYIEGRETAPTAEALMRSRYAAHTLGKYDYLNETVHPSIRDEADHGVGRPSNFFHQGRRRNGRDR